MRALTLFNPKWIGALRPNSGEGIEFDCPRCPPSAPHRLVAYFSNPVDGQPSAPHLVNAIWTREGDSFATLTITPSIQYPCWHGWVEDGQVINITEATHYATREDGRVIALSPRQVAQLNSHHRL